MFSLMCHENRTDRNGMPYTVQTNNYLMLSNAGQRLWVQGGQVWEGENSPPLKPSQYPAWFIDQIKQLTREGRKAVGFNLPEDITSDAAKVIDSLTEHLNVLPAALREKIAKVVAKLEDDDEDEINLLPEPLMAKAEKTWTCEECQHTMSVRQKGAHIGRMRRLGRCK